MPYKIKVIFTDSVEFPRRWKKLRRTFKEEVIELSKNSNNKSLLVYDIKSGPKFFCDQGCKSGEGCKKYYRDDDHALWMSYSIVKS